MSDQYPIVSVLKPLKMAIMNWSPTSLGSFSND